jgi:ubiquinone/menaquinone biosynthesis C-methylase UbiE
MATEPLSTSRWRVQLNKSRLLSGRVLDIGCGKGGDLQKWREARIKEYIALDVASVSVNQARDRWRDLKGDKFEATFAQLDCYVVSGLSFANYLRHV